MTTSTLEQPSTEQHDTQAYTHRDLYQKVTNTIIAQLEKGTVPWHKPWIGNDRNDIHIPRNHVTGKSYRGVNIVLLWSAALDRNYTSHEWASFKQWKDKKESIRKGEKGSMVVFYDVAEIEEQGEIKKIPYLKYSIVFNRCQLGSYKPEEQEIRTNATSLVKRIEDAEIFVTNTGAIVEHRDTGACYSQSEDKIYMPYQESFIDTETCTATEGYYSTLFHELTHWVGNEKRLARKFGKKFADMVYAQEELIAELGAAFLCAEMQISTQPKEDHAAYIAHWLHVLKDNKYSIIAAASEASKAVDFMRSLQPVVIM